MRGLVQLRMRGLALLMLGGLAAAGCRHTASALAPELEQQLQSSPGRYLTGPVTGLEWSTILDDRDFVWALAFSPEGSRVAYSHLAAHAYELALWQLRPAPQVLANRAVNSIDDDLEALAFSPEGALVASAGWDGQVRLFDAASGEPRATARTEEPLTAVAFHPSGKYLVAGSSGGLLTVLRVPDLAFVSEVKLHTDRVSALAFSLQGRLYSGSWDKSVRSWELREQPLPAEARARLELHNGLPVVSATFAGKAMVQWVLDSRMPAVVLGTEAARSAGIDVERLEETLTLQGPLGPTLARVARGQRLRIKGLELEGLDVAVCDSCLPAAAQGVRGVLGAPFFERVETVVDDAVAQVRLTARQAPATATGGVLVPEAAFTYPELVTDVTVDAAGQRLGVAFSEARPERTRAVYEREKQGLLDPLSEHNAAALVEARSGQVLRRWALHRGVVSTAAISPDGRALASGGWDKRLYLWSESQPEPVGQVEFGWSVRKVRFSPDGRLVGVAAWTPQKAGPSQHSDPAAALLSVRYGATASVRELR